MRFKNPTAPVLLTFVFTSFALAHDPYDAKPTARPSEEQVQRVTREMADAATNLWNALSEDQRKAVAFPFDDDAERHNFNFVPKPRKGLPWAQMSPSQQLLAHALIASGLSQRGHAAVSTIMSLEDVLADIEKGKGPKRDPGLYFFTIFGTPSRDGTWGWRVEGHHIAFNFTIVKGKAVAGSPAFLGSNPGEVREGPRKGLRILAAEQDLGFKLLESLTEAQKKAAIFSDTALKEIVTGSNRKAEIAEEKGIAYADLDATQQASLRVLLKVYAYRLRPELAEQDLAEIEQGGWEKIRFAWAGGVDRNAGHYYRIHGPTFVVEYDNTQNNANHIHTAWRNFKNDFGEDLLRGHYQAEHPQPNR
jgi:hypothetical protein